MRNAGRQEGDGAALDQGQLTGAIIGAAIEVHRALGCGFIESVYENALKSELRARAIPFVSQLRVPVFYRRDEVGSHRLDLFVADAVVVELKCIKAIEDIHHSILRSYLRAVDREHGLIINFAKPALEIKRTLSPKRAP